MTPISLERLARMEVEVIELKKSFEEHKVEVKDEFASVTEKLDKVLALSNKGAGIIWFLSLIFGSAGVAGFMNLFHYLGIK